MLEKLKFWKKKPSDETEISITESNLTKSRQIYVKAQSSEKALDLFKKLKDEKQK